MCRHFSALSAEAQQKGVAWLRLVGHAAVQKYFITVYSMKVTCRNADGERMSSKIVFYLRTNNAVLFRKATDK
jgi:hypothetical protein